MGTRTVPAKSNPYYSNIVAHATVTPATEAGDARNVAIVFKDRQYRTLAQVTAVEAYLSDVATGIGLSVAPPSGGIAAGAAGAIIPRGQKALNSVITNGDLAISATAEKFKTTALAVYTINGLVYTKAATDNLTFSAAHVVAATKYGVVLVQINAAGTISTKVPASPQTYASAPLALAALPSPDAGNVALGYITLNNSASDGSAAGAWTANTDDLTNTGDITAAAFVDATEVNTSPVAFTIVSSAAGLANVVITETGVKTFYLCLVFPDGSITKTAVAFA